MKDTADDIGDQSIDQLIALLTKIDQAIATNDRSAALQVMGGAQSLTENIMQHVGNANLTAAFAERLAALAPVMQQVQQGAPLSVLSKFISNSESTIVNAMDS